MSLPLTSGERIAVTVTRELLDCADCDIGYGLFYHLYTGNIQKIVKYCQGHGVISSAKVCPHCDSSCRIDYSCNSFCCDKSVRVRHHKKRRQCNFKVSLLKNTWFDKAHLDIETNFLFLKIFLLDKFSYKFVISELGVSTPL